MMDLTKYDTKELRGLINTINEEIRQRQEKEYKEDYEHVLSVLKNMAEKYPFDGHFDCELFDGTWDDLYDEVERKFKR